MNMPGVHNPAWVVAMFVVMLFAFAATPPMVTGLVCGWRMRAISIGRGFAVGVIVGVAGFLLSVAAILVQAPSLAVALLPVSTAVAWLLCWRENRRKS